MPEEIIPLTEEQIRPDRKGITSDLKLRLLNGGEEALEEFWLMFLALEESVEHGLRFVFGRSTTWQRDRLQLEIMEELKKNAENGRLLVFLQKGNPAEKPGVAVYPYLKSRVNSEVKKKRYLLESNKAVSETPLEDESDYVSPVSKPESSDFDLEVSFDYPFRRVSRLKREHLLFIIMHYPRIVWKNDSFENAAKGQLSEWLGIESSALDSLLSQTHLEAQNRIDERIEKDLIKLGDIQIAGKEREPVKVGTQTRMDLEERISRLEQRRYVSPLDNKDLTKLFRNNPLSEDDISQNLSRYRRLIREDGFLVELFKKCQNPKL